ncbi:hypothetical protein BVRB_1g015940 [Beta vulgaris subsp. vulgaris]|nr:hypothetical protein BVRB_1g015940 [Beta vulgaris subsp. vulgaris]
MYDLSLVLGMEIMDSVKPWRFEIDGTMMIAKGCEACSVPITREVVETTHLGDASQEKGFQRGLSIYQATLVEKGALQGDISKEVFETLKEIEDVMPPGLQKKLLPRREVDHQIELEPGARPSAMGP